MSFIKKSNLIPILLGFLIVIAGVAYFAKSNVSIKFDHEDSSELAAAETFATNKKLPEEAFLHFKRGHEFIRNKKLDNALKEFDAASQISPDSPLIHFWIAKTYAYLNEPEKAIARFKKVLELEPKNYHALSMIGRILASNKTKLDDAVLYLNQAIEINPSDFESRFYLARIYALKGDVKQSLAQFAVIFQAEPRYAVYHYELGRILEGGKAMDQAKREYQRALQLNPNLSQAKEALERLQ
jgi:tetratricopeptide (TPR) repeat protein